MEERRERRNLLLNESLEKSFGKFDTANIRRKQNLSFLGDLYEMQHVVGMTYNIRVYIIQENTQMAVCGPSVHIYNFH